jgi:acyl-CoA synthetase (AMP-forming)/AMP-acid ligase II
MIDQLPLTLPDLLNNAAMQHPQHGVAFIYAHHTSDLLRFPELRRKSMSVLAGLQAIGLEKGSKVILSLEKSEEIIPVLWACFYGGIIPALLQPPVSFTEYNPAAEKAARVFQILDNPHVVMSHEHAGNWKSSSIPENRLIDISEIQGNEADAALAVLLPGDLAMIQFSSGSTGDPKGVMLTHENILINTADIIQGIRLEAKDVAVNWMPLYHDMGLIGFHITPVFSGVTQYFINPVDFVKNPSIWLDAMSRKRCTITACPNFGQVIVNRHLVRKPNLDIDLSSLRILFNGAEPISVSTMRNFLDGLKPYGLNPVAMFPAYGLAEATLAVTFSDRLQEAEIKTFQRQKLLRHGVAEEILSGDPQGIELVNLGSLLDHCELKIVDNHHQPVAENHIGNILVKGMSITKGYFGNAAGSSALFHDGWLLTGDLGFLYQGSLFITGRSKDIIFINGINFYAHDLETIALQVDGISYGKIVIAGSFDEAEGRDKLFVFIVGANNEETRQICLSLKNHFANNVGLVTDLFIPVRSADIPRTSSGKLQRYKMVDKYLKGGFPGTIGF